MGSGLSMEDFMRLSGAEKYAASWANQDQAERKRRLSAVMQLSVELARVRETTQFSTRLCELAIESIIEGDWKMVSEWADYFAFDDEDDELRTSHAPVFATVRELLLQVVRAGDGIAS
jgi:hypothetical protein